MFLKQHLTTTENINFVVMLLTYMELSAGLYWSPRWTLCEVTAFEVWSAVAG